MSEFRASIPQDLGRDDQARRLGIDADIAGDQADLREGTRKVAKLLVRERLDRRRVDGASHVLGSESDRVLGNHGLAGARVRSDEHALAVLDVVDGLLLEGIEVEREAERHVGHEVVELAHVHVELHGPLLGLAVLLGLRSRL